MAEIERLLWRCRARTFICGARTLVIGILNVTPDSFSDGGHFLERPAALDHARAMIDAGADIIDVGGQSTQPGSVDVDLDEELRRVLPVIEEIRAASDLPLSIDTTKAEVARAALERGVEIVNDVSALRADPAMAEVAAEFEAGVILMHMQGAPPTMQLDPRYDDVVEEIGRFFEERIEFAGGAGIDSERVCIDPGIGFGKTAKHNLELIGAGWRFRSLGVPLLVGASRKSFIGEQLGLPVDQRLEGSLAAAVGAVLSGADIVRVHDVAETRKALAVADALKPHCDPVG